MIGSLLLKLLNVTSIIEVVKSISQIKNPILKKAPIVSPTIPKNLHIQSKSLLNTFLMWYNNPIFIGILTIAQNLSYEIIKNIFIDMYKLLSIVIDNFSILIKYAAQIVFFILLGIIINFILSIRNYAISINFIKPIFSYIVPSLKLSIIQIHYISVIIIFIILLINLRILYKFIIPQKHSDNVVQYGLAIRLPEENNLWSKLFVITYFIILISFMGYLGIIFFYGLSKILETYGGIKTDVVNVLSVYTQEEKIRWLNEIITYLYSLHISKVNVTAIINQIDLTSILSKEELYSHVALAIAAQSNLENIALNKHWYDIFVQHPFISITAIGLFTIIFSILAYHNREILKNKAAWLQDSINIWDAQKSTERRFEGQIRNILQKDNFHEIMQAFMDSKQDFADKARNGLLLRIVQKLAPYKAEFNALINDVEIYLTRNKEFDQTRERTRVIVQYANDWKTVFEHIEKYPDLHDFINKHNPEILGYAWNIDLVNENQKEKSQVSTWNNIMSWFNSGTK